MSPPRRKVLHLLSQRPAWTGSGVTLEALVRHAAQRGWEQRVVVGLPAGEPAPEVGGLEAAQVLPLTFAPDAAGPAGALDFRVPGMSDVMPYPSARFSALDAAQLERYRVAWRAHLAGVLERFRPDVIHAHHAWLMSALARELAPRTPLVIHGHGTDLRQLELCPHLAGEVVRGCARAERFAVLHEDHAERYARAFGLPPGRCAVVGAGFREDLFHARGRSAGPGATLVYAGKLSDAKGLPWLLDALERLREARPDVRLHVAGAGAGPESEALRARMDALAPHVVAHGQLPQAELAPLLRRATAFVLPSLHEGLPLVLVEARACGCRLVATALPGVVAGLAGPLGEALELVDPPRRVEVDRPDPRDLPAFSAALAGALERALRRGPAGPAPAGELEAFTWSAVARRVEALWLELLGAQPRER